MAEPTYDPYAYSDIGRRALGGEYIDAMNFFWFDPVTGEEGQTTEGWSRVPDYAKPYTYLDPASRNQARNTFYESGAAFGGTGGFGGGMGGLLSGQAYAQQIAGGMPFEQVVAPGMSFSPDQPMGYIAEGATPFQPRPAFFPSVQDPSVGMTGADLGLPMGAGTPMPAGVTFDPDSIKKMPASTMDVEGLLAGVDIDKLLESFGYTKTEKEKEEEFVESIKSTELAVESLLSPVKEFVAEKETVAKQPVAFSPTTSLEIQEPVSKETPVAVNIAPKTVYDLPLNLGLPMAEKMPESAPSTNLNVPLTVENLGLPTYKPVPQTETSTPLVVPEVKTSTLSAQEKEKIDRLSKNMIDAMGINIPQTATLATADTPPTQTFIAPALNVDTPLPASQRTVELPTATNLGISPFGFVNPVANVASIVAPLATNKVGMIRER